MVVAGVVGGGTLFFDGMIGDDFVTEIGSVSSLPEDAGSSRERREERRDL